MAVPLDNVFVEERLDVVWQFGMNAGPEFNTTVVELGSGFEQRNANWSRGRLSGNLGDRTLDRIEKETIIAFFRARFGRAVGFRIKDWADFESTAEFLTATDGFRTYQLRKNYINGVCGTALISAITQANPAVVTTTATHNFNDGEVVRITGATGMTEVNNRNFVINDTGSTTFELAGEDSSGFGAYTGGATASNQIVAKRDITKLVAGSVTVFRNGSSLSVTLDQDTGVFTIDTADASATITDITNATTAVVTTSAAHGYSNFDRIHIRNVVGMTEVNDLTFTIGNVASTTFELTGIDSTGFGTYSSAGVAEEYPQLGVDILTWTGEFDVPVRFDTDALQTEFLAREDVTVATAPQLYQLESLPILEILLAPATSET